MTRRSRIPAMMHWGLWGLAAAAAQAQHLPDNDSVEFQYHHRELLRRVANPAAVVHLERVFDSRNGLPDPGAVRRCLEETMRHPQASGAVASSARWLLSRYELERGSVQRAVRLRRQLGFITRWCLLGPFDNDNKAAFGREDGPERGIDFAREYRGKRGAIRWRAFENAFPLGRVHLSDVFRPTERVAAYAVAFVRLPSDADIVFRLGSDDAVKLWVDGRRLLANPAYRAIAFDQDAVGARLRAGWHEVLVKVCQDAGEWEFMCRLSRPDGRGIAGLETVCDPKKVATAAASAAPRRHDAPPAEFTDFEDAIQAIERTAASDPASATAAGALAQIYVWRHPFDVSARKTIHTCEALLRLAPGDPASWLLAARATDNLNDRRRCYEQALRLAPGLGRAHLGLARHYTAQRLYDKALSHAEQAVRADADLVDASVVLAGLYGRWHLKARGVQVLQQARRRFPHSPNALMALAGMYRALGMGAHEERAWRAALNEARSSWPLRRTVIAIAKDKGDFDDARALCDAGHALRPSDPRRLLAAANALESAERFDDAAPYCRRALAVCPEAEDAWRKLGDVVRQQGRLNDAKVAWRQALDLRPTDRRLRDLLRHFEGREPSFAERYIVDAETLSRAPRWPAEPAECLLDLRVTKVYLDGQDSSFRQKVVLINTPRGGERFRRRVITYSPARNQQLTILRARVIKPTGESLEAGRLKERALISGKSRIFYDRRAKELAFDALEPGDLLEMQYRIDDVGKQNIYADYFGTMQYARSALYPVRHKRFVLLCPASRSVYHTEPGFQFADRGMQGGYREYHWVASDREPIRKERWMPGIAERASYLRLSTFKDWQDLGRWYAALIRDQLALSTEARRAVQKITAGARDERAKIDALYAYISKQTRYVGLEFGIHGHKPYPAAQVFARKFGDCKDKAALLTAMLREAGIDATVALVRTLSRGEIDPHPPSLAAFNHAICYVPGHDLWLDCTTTFNASSELPPGDQGVMALLVPLREGCRLARTPVSTGKQNWETTSAQVKVLPDGRATVAAASRLHGLLCPSFRKRYEQPRKRLGTFRRAVHTKLPGAEVKKLRFSDLSILQRTPSYSYTLDVRDFAHAQPQTLAFPVGLLRHAVSARYAVEAQRRFDVVLPYPWRLRLRVEFSLPSEYRVQSVPAALNVVEPFGFVRRQVDVSGSRITFEGEYGITTRRIPLADYERFRRMCLHIDRCFNDKVVITK